MAVQIIDADSANCRTVSGELILSWYQPIVLSIPVTKVENNWRVCAARGCGNQGCAPTAIAVRTAAPRCRCRCRRRHRRCGGSHWRPSFLCNVSHCLVRWQFILVWPESSFQRSHTRNQLFSPSLFSYALLFVFACWQVANLLGATHTDTFPSPYPTDIPAVINSSVNA